MSIKETKSIYEALQQYHEEIIKPKVKEIVDDSKLETEQLSININEKLVLTNKRINIETPYEIEYTFSEKLEMQTKGKINKLIKCLFCKLVIYFWRNKLREI